MGQVTIVSIDPIGFTMSRTYGQFHIKPCPPEADYAFLVIKDTKEVYDMGEDKKGKEFWEALDIAKDLIQDLAKLGVFIAAGQKPTQAEIQKARETRDDWYQKLVAQGDELWAADRNMRTNGITDHHRRAAISLGLERDWAYVPRKMADCPFCQEKVKAGAVQCKFCNAILDIDGAVAGGLLTEEQAKPVRVARGKFLARRAKEGRGKNGPGRPVVEMATAEPVAANPEDEIRRAQAAEKHQARPEDPAWAEPAEGVEK